MKPLPCLILSFILIANTHSVAQAPQKKTDPQRISFFATVLDFKLPSHGDDYVEDFYFIVKYKVNKVCNGKLGDDLEMNEVNIAHRFGTARGLKVGDEICRMVEKTDEFRQMARDAYEFEGIVMPESSLSDFIFIPLEKPCDCRG